MGATLFRLVFILVSVVFVNAQTMGFGFSNFKEYNLSSHQINLERGANVFFGTELFSHVNLVFGFETYKYGLSDSYKLNTHYQGQENKPFEFHTTEKTENSVLSYYLNLTYEYPVTETVHPYVIFGFGKMKMSTYSDINSESYGDFIRKNKVGVIYSKKFFQNTTNIGAGLKFKLTEFIDFNMDRKTDLFLNVSVVKKNTNDNALFVDRKSIELKSALLNNGEVARWHEFNKVNFVPDVYVFAIGIEMSNFLNLF